MMPRIESCVGGFLETRGKSNQHQGICNFSLLLPKIKMGGWLAVFCVCVTFGHLSSASRFARACSIGAVQGVALHTVHVAKGRPLRLMRINGRSSYMVSVRTRTRGGYTGDLRAHAGESISPWCLQLVTRWPRMQASHAHFLPSISIP